MSIWDVEKERIREIMRYLRDHSMYECKSIIDIVGTDMGERLELLYILRSIRYSSLIGVRVRLREGEGIATVTEIYEGANWLEREVYDMLGIDFVGHKDQRRLLTDYGFEGHPLKKDYPVVGYTEVGYDEERGVSYRKLS